LKRSGISSRRRLRARGDSGTTPDGMNNGDDGI